MLVGAKLGFMFAVCIQSDNTIQRMLIGCLNHCLNRIEYNKSIYTPLTEIVVCVCACCRHNLSVHTCSVTACEVLYVDVSK